MKTKTLFGVMAVGLGTLALPLQAGSWAVSLSFGIPWPAPVAMPAPVPPVPAVVPYPYPVVVARPVPWYVPPACLAPPPCRPYRPVVMPAPAGVRHGQAYHHGHGHR